MDEGVKWKTTTVHKTAERKKKNNRNSSVFVLTSMSPFRGLYLNAEEQNSPKNPLSLSPLLKNNYLYHLSSKTTPPQIFLFHPWEIHLIPAAHIPGGLTSLTKPGQNHSEAPQTWFQFQVPKLNLKQHSSNLHIPSKHTQSTAPGPELSGWTGILALRAAAGLLWEVGVCPEHQRTWQKMKSQTTSSLMLTRHLSWGSVFGGHSILRTVTPHSFRRPWFPVLSLL